jgi:hypothetical protein
VPSSLRPGLASTTKNRKAKQKPPRFYAFNIGRGLATAVLVAQLIEHRLQGFYALNVGRGLPTATLLHVRREWFGFYALDVGRGLATCGLTCFAYALWRFKFLCPRCRAGLSD